MSKNPSTEPTPPSANPLGIRRRCLACDVKFYDLNKDPIICPSCGAVFDPETLLKSRRAKPTKPLEPANQNDDTADDAVDIINKDDGDDGDAANDIKDVALDVEIEPSREDES